LAVRVKFDDPKNLLDAADKLKYFEFESLEESKSESKKFQCRSLPYSTKYATKKYNKITLKIKGLPKSLTM
jgi:hypothetical protein